MKTSPTLMAALMAGVLTTAGMPAAALDLLTTYNIAAEQDPALKAAAANRNAQLETRPQARAQVLPSVGLTGSYARNRFDDLTTGGTTSYSTDQVYTLAATQTLFNWDEFIALRQADNLVAQAVAEYNAAEQELLVRVSERYFDVLAARDSLRFARAELDAIKRQLEQARERFDVGLIAITDVHEAQARYDLAVSQEIEAVNQLDSAREALFEITGVLNEPINPLGDGMKLVRPDPEDTATWVDRALENNLNLAALEAGVEAARQQVKRQRAGHYPTLDATASLARRDQNFGGIAGVERNDASIGVELNLPLFQGGAVNSRTREARYRFMESQQNLEEARRQTQRQTRDAYRGVVSGIAQVRALEQALVSTETALQAAETGFEVGTRTIVDVLDAQRERFRAQRDLARSRYNYLLSTLTLKQAAGSLGPSDLQSMNTWFQ